MTLQDQGFRFILRHRDGRVDGYWEDPALKAPRDGGIDVTDLTDDELDAAIEFMRRRADMDALR